MSKYSPTVTKSYKLDPEWFTKHCVHPDDVYDKEGFDSYGYDKNGYDRKKQNEDVYDGYDYLFGNIQKEWQNIPVIGTEEYFEHIKNVNDAKEMAKKSQIFSDFMDQVKEMTHEQREDLIKLIRVIK